MESSHEVLDQPGPLVYTTGTLVSGHDFGQVIDCAMPVALD